VSEYAVFPHGLAQQWRAERNEIWHKGSLGDEDDSRTSNTRIAQRKRVMPYLPMKKRRNIIECVVISNHSPGGTTYHTNMVRRQHQPEAFASDLADDLSHYL